jgi:hypothetical protein
MTTAAGCGIRWIDHLVQRRWARGMWEIRMSRRYSRRMTRLRCEPRLRANPSRASPEEVRLGGLACAFCVSTVCSLRQAS